MFDTQRRRMAMAAAQDSIVEKQHDDGAAPAKRDAGITGAGGNDFWRRPHEAQKLGRVEEGWNSNGQGDEQSEKDGLRAGDRGVFRVFFPDAAGNHGGGGHGKANTDREDQGQE
jgi:hypothetical protein